ncbi:hypothetical protein RyT2_24310 [Pseudolactococcus yaeyamensis]
MKKVENPFVYEYNLKFDFEYGRDGEKTYRMPISLIGESKNTNEVGFKSTVTMDKNGKMTYIQILDVDSVSPIYPDFSEEGGYWFGFTFFKDKVVMDYFYGTGDDPYREVHISQTYQVKNGKWQLKKKEGYQSDRAYLKVGRKKVKQALSALKKNDINYETLYQSVKNTKGASDAEVKTMFNDYREHLENDPTELKNVITDSQIKVEKVDQDIIKIYPSNQEFYGTNHMTMSQMMADEMLLKKLTDPEENDKETLPDDFVLTFNAKTNELSIDANNFYETFKSDSFYIKYRYTDTVKLKPTEVDGLKTYQFADSQRKIRFPDFFVQGDNDKRFFYNYFSLGYNADHRIVQKEVENKKIQTYEYAGEYRTYSLKWSDTVETVAYQDFNDNTIAQDYLQYYGI